MQCSVQCHCTLCSIGANSSKSTNISGHCSRVKNKHHRQYGHHYNPDHHHCPLGPKGALPQFAPSGRSCSFTTSTHFFSLSNSNLIFVPKFCSTLNLQFLRQNVQFTKEIQDFLKPGPWPAFGRRA